MPRDRILDPETLANYQDVLLARRFDSLRRASTTPGEDSVQRTAKALGDRSSGAMENPPLGRSGDRIERNRQVEVQGYDAYGRRCRHHIEELWARVVQHEIDHLNGVLICDKAHQSI
jgi:hypothetical protein